MKARRIAFFVLLLTVSLIGISTAEPTTYHEGGQLQTTTYHDENTAPGETHLDGNITIGWSHDVEGETASSPIMINESVYVGVMENISTIGGVRTSANMTGSVISLNSTNGDKVWEFETDGGVFSSLTYNNETIYLTTLSGYVYALNSDTGGVKWSFEANNSVFSSPKPKNNGVYFGTRAYNAHVRQDGQYYLYRLNSSDGTLDWRYQIERGIFGSPAVSDGRLYIGDHSGTVHAVTTETGKTVWKFQTRNVSGSNDPLVEMGSVHTSPVLYKDSIYVGSYNGDVYSLNSTTGRMEWQFAEGTPIVGSPAIQNETVYVGSYGGSVHALNSLNGTAEWNVSVNNSVSKSSPMVSGESLYIGTGGISAPSGSLYALNARNGTADWSLKTDDWVWSSPLLSDDRLFFTSHKSVYMIEGNSSSTEQEPRVTYNPKLGNHSTVNSSQTSDTVSEGRTDPNSTSTGYDTLDPLPNNQPVVPTVIAALLIAPILILVSSVAFERMFE